MKAALMLIVLAVTVHAQTPSTCSPITPSTSTVWDAAGDTMLCGTYYFRYVQYTVGDQQGNLSHAAALYGNIIFDGSGNYSIASAMDLDSNSMQASAVNPAIKGTYSIGANGFGFLSNPLSPKDVIWGLVSQDGIFVGSSTETLRPFNDLFIGSPLASPLPVAATLQGSYSVAYMNFPDGNVADNVAAGFQMTPDGRGHIGTVNIEVSQGGSASPADISEPVEYYFSNGAGVLSFPFYSQAISRSKYLYMSPDGGFIFGGGPDAFDLFVGVRTGPAPSPNPAPATFGYGASNFSGLYYQAGIDEIMSGSGSSLTGSLQTWYGAFNTSSGTLVGHQRIVAPLRSVLQLPANPPVQPASYPYQPFSYTYTDPYFLEFGEIGYVDPVTGRQYVIGDNGSVRLGFGVNSTAGGMGISIALQAPASVQPDQTSSTAPSTPTINPAGIQNAASFSPFTSGISPGEQIVISGSNFGAGSTVTINGTAASILNCPQQGSLCAVVPSGLPGASAGSAAPINSPYRPYPAQIVVSSNGSKSNTVWALVNQATPGVFTQSGNGLGDASATSGPATTPSTITSSNPAAVGETVCLALTGLGGAGAVAGIGASAGPACSGPSGSTSSIQVMIGGVVAVINGVSSDSGTNNVSLTVPNGASGDSLMVVQTVDATSAQVTIEVSGAGAASAAIHRNVFQTRNGMKYRSSSVTTPFLPLIQRR